MSQLGGIRVICPILYRNVVYFRFLLPWSHAPVTTRVAIRIPPAFAFACKVVQLLLKVFFNFHIWEAILPRGKPYYLFIFAFVAFYYCSLIVDCYLVCWKRSLFRQTGGGTIVSHQAFSLGQICPNSLFQPQLCRLATTKI